jgi:hypothetical protein
MMHHPQIPIVQIRNFDIQTPLTVDTYLDLGGTPAAGKGPDTRISYPWWRV